MKSIKKLALLAALGGGAMLGAEAQAQNLSTQDFSSRMDWSSDRDLMGRNPVEGTGLALKFSIPFGEVNTRRDEEPRLSLQMFNGDDRGVRKMDLLSFSFADGGTRFKSPLGFQAEGGQGGNWFAEPMNWVWLGLGAVAVWAIVDATQDDDDDAPVQGPS